MMGLLWSFVGAFLCTMMVGTMIGIFQAVPILWIIFSVVAGAAFAVRP